MKGANTRYPINNFAKNRWSPRAFSPELVPVEKLQSLFEAARWAASAMNEQPWRFILGIKPDETWNKILETLMEGNIAWAKEAPVLIIALGKTNYSHDDSDNSVFSYDVGQSVANLAIEAMNQGIYVHQMAGFSALKAIDNFYIPDVYQPITVIAAGYIGDADVLPENLKKRELAKRTRKEFNQFVFSSRFGQVADIFNT
jgi:nitroreductase